MYAILLNGLAAAPETRLHKQKAARLCGRLINMNSVYLELFSHMNHFTRFQIEIDKIGRTGTTAAGNRDRYVVGRFN